jgi:hypothetical protein
MPSAAASCALRDRRLERIELGVGEITQVAERRDAVARQHVVHIGEIAAAVLGRIVLRDVIAQVVEARAGTRHPARRIALARPRQEVGDVGVQPHVAAARPPQAERAVRALPRQHALDRRP